MATEIRIASTAEIVQGLYESRRDRQSHPDGTFDQAGRWYPSAAEECECCQSVRSPSRSYPYSYMLHCRTRRHCAALVMKQDGEI